MIRNTTIPGQTDHLSFPELGVDVWILSLSAGFPRIEALRMVVSQEELARADRFHQPAGRSRFIVAHAALRLILGDQTGLDPKLLQFDIGAQGKPFLVRAPGAPDIRFNLSHSGDRAAIAVTRDRDIGIDIERLAPERSNLAVADRFFSDVEIATLRSLPEADRTNGFFNCWTRKEVYIKGRGEGLSIPLNSFDVSLAPGEPAALLASRFDPTDVEKWYLRDISVADGYVAAFAVERT